MRTFIPMLALVFGVLMLPATPVGGSASSDMAIGASAVLGARALQEPQPAPQPQPPQINVEVNRGGGRAWYLSPVWMAIGGIGLVVLILLIVMAARGGGTTVVRG